MANVGREEEAAAAAAAEATGTGAQTRQGTSERRQTEANAAGASPATGQEQLSESTKLKMRAYRNLRYHSDRQSYYERLTRRTNFVLVLLGSASFAAVFASQPMWTALGAALVTIVASAQLVFDFSRRAKDEDVLKLECARILSESEDPAADIPKIEAAMASLYGRELETYHAVNALAYNATQLAFGRPASTLLVVQPWQKYLRHWWVFSEDDFPDRQPSL